MKKKKYDKVKFNFHFILPHTMLEAIFPLPRNSNVKCGTVKLPHFKMIRHPSYTIEYTSIQTCPLQPQL